MHVWQIEEHRFTATCMEMKLLKSIRYPHSKLNISNEELYARACIDRVPEDEWRTFVENALGMSLGKYSGVWRANGKWDVSKKELANAQDHVPMLLNARIEPAFTGVAAGVQAETNLLKAAGAHFSSYRVATRFGSGFINCTRCGKGDTHVLFLHGYGSVPHFAESAMRLLMIIFMCLQNRSSYLGSNHVESCK